MLTFVRHYLLALQFFSRVPVTGRLASWVGYSPAMLRASAAHFPGIGWLVGAICGGSAVLLPLALPQTPMSAMVAAVLVTIASVLLTGAFHEDGLADVADGLGGSADRMRALDIMKDSRIGAFGALALLLVITLKLALLAVLWPAPAAEVTTSAFLPASYDQTKGATTWKSINEMAGGFQPGLTSRRWWTLDFC